MDEHFVLTQSILKLAIGFLMGVPLFLCGIGIFIYAIVGFLTVIGIIPALLSFPAMALCFVIPVTIVLEKKGKCPNCGRIC